MAFFYGLGIISMAFMSRSPTLPEQSRWVFQMTAWINAALVAAMVVTLILRGVAPRAGSDCYEGAEHCLVGRNSVWNSVGYLRFDEGRQGGRAGRA